MRQFNSTTRFALSSVNREPAALDMLENQFVERCQCRRSPTVIYPSHIPVPRSATHPQRRSLDYPLTMGISSSFPLPVLGRTLSFPLATVYPQSTVYSQSMESSMTHNYLTASRQRRQTTRQELEMVHRQNLQRLLNQRIEAARARGNEQLLHQLAKEMDLIA